MAAHRIFGIRHHGVGSARRLVPALSAFAPDVVLVEGPADADPLIAWLGHEDMVPPVALMVYCQHDPTRAVTYPFAEFSPEYQALRYAVRHGIPARFMDLPPRVQLADREKAVPPPSEALQAMATAAGYKQYESWWHQTVERPLDSDDHFAALLDMMGAARAAAETVEQARDDLRGLRREAAMRQTIRNAFADGYLRVAVVCGAWHGPALINLDDVAADAALLRDLPEVAVAAAWVPWTYGRLAMRSGYGAGIHSPGWYHHLWQMGQQQATPESATSHWLTQVAGLLRGAGFDASAAHVIEAVRLANSLAAVRERPFPGLAELNDAVQTVMCGGADEPLSLIRHRLIISERMGSVPPDAPLTPLQRDLHSRQKQLRLYPDPNKNQITLDLRQPTDLARSHLLHRLLLLKIPWGQPVRSRGVQGTFQEVWQLQWQPDFEVRVVEAGMWGHTVMDAAGAAATAHAQQAADLADLTNLLDRLLLAEMPDVVPVVMQRIEDEAASSSDMPHLMAALPPLARVLRYGSVRQTDVNVVQQVVDGLLTRICVGLPSSCTRMDGEAAAEMEVQVTAVHRVVHTLQQAQHITAWTDVLHLLLTQPHTPGLLAGRACRLLMDSQQLAVSDVAVHLARALPMPQAMTTTAELMEMGEWLNGFLKGSDLLLIHDEALWEMLDAWLLLLSPAHFQDLLPLLRRAFAEFSQAARRQLGLRARHRQAVMGSGTAVAVGFDNRRADSVLPLLAQLLGVGAANDQVGTES